MHSPGTMYGRGGVRDHRRRWSSDAFVGDGLHRVDDRALDAAEVRDAVAVAVATRTIAIDQSRLPREEIRRKLAEFLFIVVIVTRRHLRRRDDLQRADSGGSGFHPDAY